MSTVAEAVSPHRLATTENGHAAQHKLRVFSVGAVLCGVCSSGVLLAQAYTSPYPVQPSLLLLVTCFLLITVVVRLGLTRYRWYEVLEEGLRYKAPLNQVRMIPWKAMRDVRYLVGVALPFSVKVEGRRAPVRLGTPHGELADWTDTCLKRMSLDPSSGGPLHATRHPTLYWIGVAVLALAAPAIPFAILRALNDLPQVAFILLPLLAGSGAVVTLLREPLYWSPDGITLGRGRRRRHIAWADLQAEWRRTPMGGPGLFVIPQGHAPMRVGLGQWGAPRFVARLGSKLDDTAASSGTAAGTGVLFPIMLAVLTLCAGLQFREGAQLLSNFSGDHLAAMAGGTPTGARPLTAQIGQGGFEVRYTYRAHGKKYRGRGWLPPTSRNRLQTTATVRAAFAPGAPHVSVLLGDPRLFHAAYCMLFGLFHALFVLPLMALWDLTPAPMPYTVPALPLES